MLEANAGMQLGCGGGGGGRVRKEKEEEEVAYLATICCISLYSSLSEAPQADLRSLQDLQTMSLARAPIAYLPDRTPVQGIFRGLDIRTSIQEHGGSRGRRGGLILRLDSSSL